MWRSVVTGSLLFGTGERHWNDSGIITSSSALILDFFYMTQKPPVGQDLLIIEAIRSRLVKTHHSRQEASGRVIDPSHRPLPDKRQTSMSPTGFESTVPVIERPQTHTLDRAATLIGCCLQLITSFLSVESVSGISHLTFYRRNVVCFIWGISPYRAVNTFRHGYKNQSVNDV
jgi:hypothetical protein